jgi:hypothetical protein
VKSTEITVSKSITLQVKQFEPETIFVAMKEVVDDEKIDRSQRARELLVDCNILANAEKERMLNKMKSDALAGMRFYEKDGKKYPSVTSIISQGEEYTGNPLCGLKGDVLHRIFARMVSDGRFVWDVTEEDAMKLGDKFSVKTSDLDWITNKFAGKLDFRGSEVEVYNDEHTYAGRYDADGYVIESEAGDGVAALFDLKSGNMTTEAKEKAFIQMAAYSQCVPQLGIEEMVILSTQKKDIFTSTDILGYFAKFLALRKSFREKFNV